MTTGYQRVCVLGRRSTEVAQESGRSAPRVVPRVSVLHDLTTQWS
jgi:hypothetical protein